MHGIIDRRQFIRSAAAASLAWGISGLGARSFAAAEDKPVRIGFVGTGNRGNGLIRHILAFPGVEFPALADIDEDNINRAASQIQEKLGYKPELYTRGPEDYKRLVERDDLDAVITATPWQLHTPVCVAAMEAGKYAATEVPAAVTVDECWQLVETSERTGKPCMMLENVCYYRNVLLILNMVAHGAFGELLHSEAGYQHDVRYLRGVEGKIGPEGELLWRGKHAITRDGNLYPTHPIGPVAWWFDINRGDRFEYLVSMSTKSRGMNHRIAEMFGHDHPNARRSYALGDINTTLIRTANGLTVTLYHDTQSPRPYDLIFRIQGTKGIYQGTLDKFYIEGVSPEEHTWEDPQRYREKYEHPLWAKIGAEAQNYGHSGGDYIEWHQFLHAVRNGLPTPIDVYDSATWSVISPLSEQSVANRSAPADFPDFTRGKWREKRQIPFYGI